MSRHPSPGPSHGHIFQPVSTPSTRYQKSRAYMTGIAAGAEDTKYATKYKELKKKVKEIESDNDKLHFKVLQAKRSIQRMKLERAVLYERLSAVPPSPELQDRQALPPIYPGPGVPPHEQQAPRPPPHHHPHREGRESRDASEQAYYMQQQQAPYNEVRVMAGPDGRPVPVAVETPMGPGVAPPSHGLAPSTHHRSRRTSGSGNDASRQLPPLSQMAPVQHMESSQRNHGHPHSMHSSPHMSQHLGPSPTQSRSQSTSRSRAHQNPPSQSLHSFGHGHHSQQPPPEALPSVQHVLHSPSLSTDRARPSRRRDHDEGHHRLPMPSQPAHPHSHSNSPTETRSSGRIHNHQRIGPGANINYPDERYEIERGREWERDREQLHSPSTSHRQRRQEDHMPTSRVRDDHPYHGDAPGPSYPRPVLSRSGTPGSGSGSGSGNGAGDDPAAPSRADSRAQHHYEREREREKPPRGYRDAPTRSTYHPGAANNNTNSGSGNDNNSNIDFVHEDGRSPLSSRVSLARSSSRKRPWDEMEVDEDYDVDPRTGTAEREGAMGRSAGYLYEDRGSKRHQQDRGSAVDREEGMNRE